jgi:hypothetical protein
MPPDECSADHLNATDGREWIARISQGDFEGAWRASDRIRSRTRWPTDVRLARHRQQIWDGTDLRGRRVLIRCYHGLGDTIQFIRYACMVKARASEVIVWVQPRLLPLLETARGVDRWLALHDGSPEVEYDVDVEIMELPYVFRTTLATIPSAVPYLWASPPALGGRRPRIGIVWRAGDWDACRSIPFDRLAPLLYVDGVSWYQLQHPVHATERHPALRPIDCNGIQRTADYMSALDLVITIDSMSAHLAGALGLTVWTLLPHQADWRWMESRCDTPWYPTMRLFRQPAPGDWDTVIEDVRHRLLHLLGGH